MASSHVYLCNLIFLIWKDTSLIITYEKMHCLNFFLKCLWLLCVHLSSIGEEEVKRRGYEVLNLCEFRYSCFLLWIQLSNSALQEYQFGMTTIISNVMVNKSCEMDVFCHYNHSLMTIMKMCIKVVFRNSNWIEFVF